MTQGPVLVTGASGFIAKHCIAELLRRNFEVRGTLRNLDRAGEVKSALSRAGVDGAGLEFIAADLAGDKGWDEAVAGVSGILHVASPFPIEQPRHREEIVAPARDGAMRLLSAATHAGIGRVVMTSSTVAVMYASNRSMDHIYTEDDWSDEGRADITPYIASKTIAERAAWSYVKDTFGAPELTVINPAFVQGPALDRDLSTSLEVDRLMGRGAYPAVPRVAFPICDVRDVAAAHVVALTSPAAAGKRFIIANGNLALIDIGRQIAAELPDLARKVPKFELPDFAVRAMALFDRRLQSALPELGLERRCASAQAKDVLGLNLRTAEEAVRSTARSLRELAII